jgi:hypothetical protein
MTYTTEVSHTQTTTGNRDFSVTFPFLATTDIKVQLNGVTKSLTSDYTIVQSGANTVVNFNTAPADNATIRIFRSTNIDSINSTYAAGSSIRSTDLNTNNTQLLYAAQEFGKLKEDDSVAFSLGNKGDVQINTSSDWVIRPDAIELGMMTNNSVGTNELVNESVTSDKLADFAITASELATNSVTQVKVQDNAINASKIAANAVTTAKIATGAVTIDKLSNSAASGFGFTPVGTVIWYAGSTAPTGYIKCNGDSIANGTGTTQGVTADFSALYAVVGANVPDLRGEFIRGLDDSRGIDTSRSIRSSQNDQNKLHNHSVSATSTPTLTDPGHTHQARVGTSGTGGGNISDRDSQSPGTYVDNQISNVGTGISVSVATSISENNNGGSEARPRNVALLACIKY